MSSQRVAGRCKATGRVQMNTFRELCTELLVGYTGNARYSVRVLFVPVEAPAVRQG